MQLMPADAEWLRTRFDAGATISEVARELGVSYTAVVEARRRLKVAPKNRPSMIVDLPKLRALMRSA